MTGHFQSSGRGGAGNIVDSSKSPRIQPEDLQTPTLKTAMVTTGRGGTGNMAKNSDPVETRKRQDVEPVVRRDSFGATHIGRGGTGNVFTAEDAQAAREARKNGNSAVEKEDENHLHLHNLLHPSRTHNGHHGSGSNHHKENKVNKDTAVAERQGHKKGEKSESDLGWAEKGKNFLFGKKDKTNEKTERSSERKSGNSSS
ncbi:hypothetical protein SMACR_04823 [Sordaria macrospora]|uniref:WGS project CABT00000000 data, contig 2.1 n=2 Tax=Sordaria macrospora TaxID=5147 RepID=F7VLQ4_SORMK|nr:uncharacterized protein SMAC_04823 [Sordaria macrospora k-hell]KAA8633367.1 hypothetical protein SMACR_04823 [Sordaria macrospora]KAH7627370.1 hypothetical protein B0T09DRAFT_403687 [Sordaria sp. MPI-SDFR-AT-0083]WPJ59399.1 hypothetical protein SMAC4_04823 [Sordaria macrospora]CCC06432.1 unnamed protein product [Sordaria macrospora k-hell]